MKPVELITNELKISSNKQSVVVDFYGGSGSTLIACEQLERVCYMCEIDPKYVDVIIKRWENLTGQKAELIKE
jgi:site-specific DNA-methyltransferase (adenine-specific)